MKLKQIVNAVALAVALGGGAVASHAATITIPAGDATVTGTFEPFGGFDWASDGSAVVDGFTLTTTGQTTLITLDYWSSAARVTTPTQTTLVGPTLGILTGEIEYTIVANITEVATCLADNGVVCTAASFVVASGTWNIFYDTTPDAVQLAGTGFNDGVTILSGDFDPAFSGTFVGTPTGGIGSTTLSGSVLFTNNTYINPDLEGTNAATTLQLGTDRTDGGGVITGRPPAGAAVICGPLLSNQNSVCFQADANQTFDVPEPGSLALLGISLLGLAGIRRRRK